MTTDYVQAMPFHDTRLTWGRDSFSLFSHPSIPSSQKYLHMHNESSIGFFIDGRIHLEMGWLVGYRFLAESRPLDFSMLVMVAWYITYIFPMLAKS